MTERRSKRKLSYAEMATSAESGTTSCCFLCNGHHLDMTNPSHWKSDDAQKYILAQGIPEGEFVCQICRKDITEVISDSSFKLRWFKLQGCSRKCGVRECNTNVFTSLNQGSCEQIAEVFATLRLQSSTPTISLPLPLCKQHYHVVYKTL